MTSQTPSNPGNSWGWRGEAQRRGDGGKRLALLGGLWQSQLLKLLRGGFSSTFQGWSGNENLVRCRRHTLETGKHCTHFLDIIVKESLMPTHHTGPVRRRRTPCTGRELFLTLISVLLGVRQTGLTPIGQNEMNELPETQCPRLHRQLREELS